MDVVATVSTFVPSGIQSARPSAFPRLPGLLIPTRHLEAMSAFNERRLCH